MPIPVEKLKRASRPLRERILEFLSADRAHAYSIEEIYVAVEGHGEDASDIWLAVLALERHQKRMKPYVDALQSLVKERAVAMGKVGETPYFSMPAA